MWRKRRQRQPREAAGTVLVDSGADDHICHPELKKERRIHVANKLSHHGTRYVNLTVGTQGQRTNIDFQVADISDNIFSLENLLRSVLVFR